MIGDTGPVRFGCVGTVLFCRRKFLPSHDFFQFVIVEDLPFKQVLRESVKHINIIRQDLFGSFHAAKNDLFNFVIDILGGLLAVIFMLRYFASKEDLFFFGAV